MVTGLGGAFHIVEPYNVTLLENILVKPCLSCLIKHGRRTVHGEHPSGPRAVLLIGQAKGYAIRRSYRVKV